MSQTEKLHDATWYLNRICADFRAARNLKSAWMSPLIGSMIIIISCTGLVYFFGQPLFEKTGWQEVFSILMVFVTAAILCAMICDWKYRYPGLPLFATYTDRLFWALANYPVGDDATRKELVMVQDAMVANDPHAFFEALDHFAEVEADRLGEPSLKKNTSNNRIYHDQFLNRPLRDQKPSGPPTQMSAEIPEAEKRQFMLETLTNVQASLSNTLLQFLQDNEARTLPDFDNDCLCVQSACRDTAFLLNELMHDNGDVDSIRARFAVTMASHMEHLDHAKDKNKQYGTNQRMLQAFQCMFTAVQQHDFYNLHKRQLHLPLTRQFDLNGVAPSFHETREQFLNRPIRVQKSSEDNNEHC